jgi:uncharacterized protein YecE (DUF72 family)
MIIVGTSGWQYRDWRSAFYPAELASRRWLEYYAERCGAVEVNNTFYRLPPRSTVKMSRYLTHIRRLRAPVEPVSRFMTAAGGLGAKLGPVLFQLPPTLTADAQALDAVLSRLAGRARVAVEPRHPSWWDERIRATLDRHGAALCWADRDGRPVTPLWRTAGFGYLRMHHGTARPRPRYGQAAIRSWVDRVASTWTENEPVYVFFNNDHGGAAIVDASAFAATAARRGLPVSRTPDTVRPGFE